MLRQRPLGKDTAQGSLCLSSSSPRTLSRDFSALVPARAGHCPLPEFQLEQDTTQGSLCFSSSWSRVQLGDWSSGKIRTTPCKNFISGVYRLRLGHSGLMVDNFSDTSISINKFIPISGCKPIGYLSIGGWSQPFLIRRLHHLKGD